MPSYWLSFIHPVDGVHGGIRVSAVDPEKALDAVAHVNPGPAYHVLMLDEDAYIQHANARGMSVSRLPVPSNQYILLADFDRYGLIPHHAHD